MNIRSCAIMRLYKSLVFVAATSFLISSFFISPHNTKAADLNVPSGYATIQSAINAASAGDNIYVATNTYYEHITINKSVNIIGANQTTTAINGSGTGVVVTITASNVNISNLTIENSGTDLNNNAGILMVGVSGCTISDTTIANNINGVGILSSSYNTISNSTIDVSGRYGIVLTAYPATPTVYSLNNNISSNTITNTGRDAIYVDENSNNNSITDNIINNITGTTEGSNYEGNGIYFWKSGGHTVTGNTITNAVRYGIEMMGSSDNTISDNTITNNYDGLLVRSGVLSSTNSTISGNTITDNSNAGIVLRDDADGNNYAGYVSGNTIDSNSIYNNGINLLTESSPTGTVYSAINNFWGDANPDWSSTVSSNIDYSPWYTDENMTSDSTEKAIITFTFASPSAVGSVNETAHTISIIVPFITDVTSLAPTISLSAGASVVPASGTINNFTQPQIYTVTAPDGSTQEYMVTVVKYLDPSLILPVTGK